MTQTLMLLPAKSLSPALADVTQWIEHQPANLEVAGSIPSQGACLGCGPGPHLGECERHPISVSLPLFPPSPLSENK